MEIKQDYISPNVGRFFLLDLGATTPMFYAFREREEIIKLFEGTSGQRMMYNFYTFGGVKKDFS